MAREEIYPRLLLEEFDLGHIVGLAYDDGVYKHAVTMGKEYGPECFIRALRGMADWIEAKELEKTNATHH